MKILNLLFLVSLVIGCVFVSGCIVDDEYIVQDNYRLYGYDYIDIAVDFDTINETGILSIFMKNSSISKNVTLLFDYSQREKNKIVGFPYASYLDGIEYDSSYIKDIYFVLLSNYRMQCDYGNEFVILESR